ncbi:MAG: RNase H family protein, partial [Chloroflexota bacterium]|nr:RNase H family protein [Chloroflexota bacterium]
MFTDGACLGNPGPGGYAAILVSGPHKKDLNGGFRLTTNNRMELMAIIVGLELLQRTCEVVVSSDSQYVVQAMQKRWPQRWRADGWRLADRLGKPGSGGLAKNPDLWERLL